MAAVAAHHTVPHGVVGASVKEHSIFIAGNVAAKDRCRSAGEKLKGKSARRIAAHDTILHGVAGASVNHNPGLSVAGNIAPIDH